MSPEKRPRIGRSLKVLACLAVISLLAACGSDDDEFETSAGTAEETASAASEGGPATGDPIKIGTVQTVSGSFGLKILGKIGDVWVEWKNDNGGINGHPVELYNLDDATDPARGLSATRELIDQRGVIAIVGSSAVSSTNIAQYASAKGVPIIGGVTAQTAPGKLSFPAATDLTSMGEGGMDVVKEAGFTKIGRFSCVESAACTAGNDTFRELAEERGLEVTDIQKVSSTAPDYTAPCRTMIGSGADVVSIATAPVIAQRIMQTCIQQGSTFAFTTNSGTALPTWPKEEAFKGSSIYITNDVWPFTVQETTAQKQFFEVVEEYAPEMMDDPFMGAYVQGIWAGLEMFAAVAEAGDIGPDSTAADVVEAVYDVEDESLDGLIGPVTYREGDTHLAPCYFATLLEGGTYSTPFGTEPRCVE